MIINWVRNVRQVSSEISLPWLVQNKPSAPIRRVENKVEFLDRQFHSEKLLFVHKKETEHSFELSLSICVFYRRIFNLEMQNFSLENHHIMIARQPFCWWMTFTKVSNPFLPSPLKWLTWKLDVFRGVGYRWFYWFSLYWNNFFLNLSGVRNFSPTYNGVRIFSALYVMSDIFFQCRIFFSQEFILSLQEIFLKSPIPPSKVKWSAPKIHQTFGQLTDSDLSSFLKAFETIWDKTLQWRGEEFVSTYPYPEVRSDVRTGVRWCHNQIFSDG